MELLFVALIGLLLGLVAHAVLPGRSALGRALLPSVGGAVAMIVWASLTWARLAWNLPWIWVATLVVTALAVLGGGVLLIRARRRSDEALFDRISRAV